MDASLIEVLIDHPHGGIWTPLSTWFEHGPGSRPLLRAVAVRRGDIGASLPLSVVPFRFRNTVLSRLLIRLRLLPNPWPAQLNVESVHSS